MTDLERIAAVRRFCQHPEYPEGDDPVVMAHLDALEDRLRRLAGALHKAGSLADDIQNMAPAVGLAADDRYVLPLARRIEKIAVKEGVWGSGEDG